MQIKELNFRFNFSLKSFANQRVELSSRFFFESHLNDLSRSDDNLLRIRESSIIRDKDRSRESVSKQKQMFKRFNQRKRFNFKQMKKNFNINSIEGFEQMKQSFFKRRSRSSERERREKREDNKNVKRDAQDDDARDDVKDNVKNDATDKTNVLMKNVFRSIFQFRNERMTSNTSFEISSIDARNAIVIFAKALNFRLIRRRQ